MKDGPVKDLDDVLVGEIVGSAFSGVAKGIENGDNGFPQLVFHELLLLVMLQELS